MKKFLSDKKKRQLFYKYECKNIEYKSMASNKLVSINGKKNQKVYQQNRELPRNSSYVRIRNRCIETGRGRAVFRFCKLSRIKLRLRAISGNLPGIEKCSW
jgi:small subunit ribosomal protein S14